MADPVNQPIEIAQVAQQLKLSESQVRCTVELLDDGNTVPFITRYRRHRTGSLDEEMIREVQQRVARIRQLADRKQTILKSIEGQDKLTPELAQAIEQARSNKRLEDLYLPFKPKKTTLATLAKARGLQPLAEEILAGTVSDLESRIQSCLTGEEGLDSQEAIQVGVGHLIAEHFSVDADLRERLRNLLSRHGRIVCTQHESAEAKSPDVMPEGVSAEGIPTEQAAAAPAELAVADTVAESTPDVEPAAEVVTETSADPGAAPPSTDEATTPPEVEPGESPEVEAKPELPANVSDVEASASESDAKSVEPPTPAAPATTPTAEDGTATAPKKQSVRQRKRKKLESAFRDYFDFGELLSKLPPHRVLAINRGEKAKILRVRVESDPVEMIKAARRDLFAEDHPQVEFLGACLQDALSRLVLPSLERELRRELTEKAEKHAVNVFARNLRSLLLQAPVRHRRVLAIDPGFRSGCKVLALDEFGSVLGHAVVHLVGTDERRQQALDKIAAMVSQLELTAIVIGNGTACRETEQLVAEAIAGPLADREVSYTIVNEAGASVYSTSATGREELPDLDATLRSAVSIGRRLLDPLSELVKINPANIGVGLYQHDVKSKHLRESLDAVVESCVNFVGVDVNMASPALLGYVSGLNQLTARRLYEHRQAHGPFRSREEFKNVAGFGDATFVQSAGFLRIADAEDQLDATWIHPESYPIANRILARLSQLAGDDPEVGDEPSWTDLIRQVEKLNRAELVQELETNDVLLDDILTAIATRGRDPREDLPAPVFRRGIRKIEDLEPGMELQGTVLNVVDFGVFVDIGLNDSGLIHISRLSNRFVRDPHDVVSVGDTIRTWVISIDKERRRVSLTAIEPGKEAPQTPRSKRPASKGKRPPKPAKRKAKGNERHKAHRSQGQRPPKPKRPPKPPKPVKPITEEMVEGKEPMRSFSDLMQFYEKKSDDDD